MNKNRLFSKILSFLLLLFVLIANIFLIGKNLFDPFIRFNEDNNAVYGLAAQNWLRFGLFKLKFGMVPYWLDDLSQKINYYTHHPDLFILPTLIFYKFFGVNEFTTRLSPLIFSLLSIIFFFLLIYEIYRDYFLAFLSSFIFATLPAITFYGKMLDHEIFVLFFALFSLSLFFKIKNSPKNFLIYLFSIVIFLGNFNGWHFYFVPLIIWFLILLDKNYPKRDVFLILIPLIEFLSYDLMLFHFYILGGKDALFGLKEAFIFRTSSLPFNLWANRIWFLLKLNFALPIVILGIFWIFYIIFNISKDKKLTFDLVLFLFPFFVTIIFRQWVTHAYGPFYYVGFFALAGGKFLYLLSKKLNEFFKNKIVSLLLILLLLGGQFYSGFVALKFFDKNLILNKESIEFLKEIKNDLNPKTICLGENQTGLGYSAIFSFYLKTKIVSSSKCLEEKVPLAIIFHPQWGDFYNKEAQLFLKNNYQIVNCKGIICLLLSSKN